MPTTQVFIELPHPPVRTPSYLMAFTGTSWGVGNEGIEKI